MEPTKNWRAFTQLWSARVKILKGCLPVGATQHGVRQNDMLHIFPVHPQKSCTVSIRCNGVEASHQLPCGRAVHGFSQVRVLRLSLEKHCKSLK